jgi:hypothetical protein
MPDTWASLPLCDSLADCHPYLHSTSWRGGEWVATGWRHATIALGCTCVCVCVFTQVHLFQNFTFLSFSRFKSCVDECVDVDETFIICITYVIHDWHIGQRAHKKTNSQLRTHWFPSIQNNTRICFILNPASCHCIVSTETAFNWS